jgi:hypothetical protein
MPKAKRRRCVFVLANKKQCSRFAACDDQYCWQHRHHYSVVMEKKTTKPSADPLAEATAAFERDFHPIPTRHNRADAPGSSPITRRGPAASLRARRSS